MAATSMMLKNNRLNKINVGDSAKASNMESANHLYRDVFMLN